MRGRERDGWGADRDVFSVLQPQSDTPTAKGRFLTNKARHAREHTHSNIPKNHADDGGGDIFVALSSVEECYDGLVLELADLVEKVSDVVVRNELPAAPTRGIPSSAVCGDEFVCRGGRGGEGRVLWQGNSSREARRRRGGDATDARGREAARGAGKPDLAAPGCSAVQGGAFIECLADLTAAVRMRDSWNTTLARTSASTNTLAACSSTCRPRLPFFMPHVRKEKAERGKRSGRARLARKNACRRCWHD